MECEVERKDCENLDKNKNFSDEKMVENHINNVQNKENSNPNMENGVNNEPQRRHDEPSELSFEICMLFLNFYTYPISLLLFFSLIF